MISPFAPSKNQPGKGTVTLSAFPNAGSVIKTLSFQYPLKLVVPAPVPIETPTHTSNPLLVHTVFLLTYGGGIVAGDTIDLTITLDPATRLILLTQGSTKIFKTPERSVVSGQQMAVDIPDGAALCYLPDPVQPFESSAFQQVQVYNFKGLEANLCVCDWVTGGRKARGEHWDFYQYASKNEVWLHREGGKRRLLLRDNVILDDDSQPQGLKSKMDGLGVCGTLILGGPLFAPLGKYFMDEFDLLPRIGARKWDARPEEDELSPEESRRMKRQRQETAGGLLWTAASIRGFVVVKFGAVEVEAARRWLAQMLKAEGTLEREFGERALLCLKW